ncbi:MAG: hypothetical protein PVJ67_03855 [Candidatus Pacearchaeota archaeon]|jgi:hypothetical protein
MNKIDKYECTFNYKKTFKVEMYGCRINVYFCDTWKEFATSTYEFLSKEKINLLDTEAFCFAHNREYYVFFDTNVKMSIIVHECIHLLMFIIDDYELELNINTQEWIAYLMQFFVDKILEIKELITNEDQKSKT